MKHKVDTKNEAYKSKGMKQHAKQGESKAQADVRDNELRPTKGKMPEMGKKAKDQASKDVASMEIGRTVGRSGKGKSDEAAKAESGSPLGKPQGDDYPNPAKKNSDNKY